MSCDGLVAVLEAVQELCRSSHGVRASLRESSGCVWRHQHRCAGDDVLELPLGWMSGAIVSDQDVISKIRAHCGMRNEHGYNSLTGRSAIADVQTLVRGRPKTVVRTMSAAHPSVL